LIGLVDESLESGKPTLCRRTDLYDRAAYFGGRNKKAALVDRLLCDYTNRKAKAPEKKPNPLFAVSGVLMQANSHHGSDPT
jgi:hypothetical protein